MTPKCQPNIVVCSIPRKSIESFSPEDHHQASAAWVPFTDNGTHHIIILRLKDIVGDSTTEVRMNVVTDDYNSLPSPFTFQVVNQITGTSTESSMMAICLV